MVTIKYFNNAILHTISFLYNQSLTVFSFFIKEWLWPIGYFLRAKLKFADQKEVAVTCIHQALSAHAQALEDSPWAGLPELTNKDGVECADSCPVQAWSMATLLDVLYDLTN